jgi:hypothetical protein
MGIFKAWPMTHRPNRLMMLPEKISALRSFFSISFDHSMRDRHRSRSMMIKFSMEGGSEI